MNLFDKIFTKKEQNVKIDSFFKTLNAYTPVFSNWCGCIYEQELVRAAINARANHISKMKVELRGAARPKLQTKMKIAPNEFMTWSQLLYRLSTILDIENTAYIVPVLGEYDEVTGIYPIVPTRCELVQSKGVPYIRYFFATGDAAAVELSRVGIMTKFQYKSDFRGESNSALTDTMNLIAMQSQAINEGVKSAATYRFMAQIANFSKAEDLAKERKRFSTANLANDADGGGLLLFPNTYSNVQQIKSSPYTVDAEQMKLIRTNVFDYFGVNEEVLQGYAGGEKLDAFYNCSLEPFAIQLADVLTKMIYSMKEQSFGASVVVSSNRLQYMTVADKVNLVTSLADRGAILIDEIRDLFNYAPLPNGDGQVAPVRGEYYSVSEMKEGENNEE